MFDLFKGLGTKVLMGSIATVGVFMLLSNSSSNTTQPKTAPVGSTLNGATQGKRKKCATLKV